MDKSNTEVKTANDTQIGGDHYKIGGEEHWDRVQRLGLDYFQGQITKYVERWKKKNGVQDLLKARHFLDKYIEIQQREVITAPGGPFVLTPYGEKLRDEAVKLAEQKQALMTRGQRVLSYRDFTFEGSMGMKSDFYTCKHCGWKQEVPKDQDPNLYHSCARPNGYVNQD